VPSPLGEETQPRKKFQVPGRRRRGVLPETRQARRHEEAQVPSPETEAAAGGTARGGGRAQAGGRIGTSNVKRQRRC
jgi:hypothetical protein